ncbi:cysteinyl leukotriene receptor 1-like [Physella acuta]|uniref:cysteinyl leukotriene receptor 1-like n=1 Tax=Physella acuta TaxID=109671 RepID=UPI0027DC72F0|nr:cysteinyl leukotriene receptor 1-like [Physella acuta]
MSLIASVGNMSRLHDGPIIDDDLYVILVDISANSLTVLVSLFGMLTNGVNILIFLRQGFSEQVTITLLALAVSDMMALMVNSIPNLVFFIALKLFGVALFSDEITYVTTGTLHLAFVRVTGWLTAFITFERCLCVTLPLHVRSAVTKRRVTFVVIAIYIFSFSCLAPTYYTTYYNWSYLPHMNSSYLILMDTDHRVVLDHMSFIIGNVFPAIASFSIVLLSTVFLSIGLISSKTFHKHHTKQLSVATDKFQRITRKKIKIIKLTSLLALIFIVTFTPTIIFTVWIACDPGFSATGFNSNFFKVAFSFSFLMESLNSSLHVFPYYSMSTNYRTRFKPSFSCFFTNT